MAGTADTAISCETEGHRTMRGGSPSPGGVLYPQSPSPHPPPIGWPLLSTTSLRRSLFTPDCPHVRSAQLLFELQSSRKLVGQRRLLASRQLCETCRFMRWRQAAVIG